MNNSNGRFDFSPRVEIIGQRDIRKAFALPRFDDFERMRELNKPFDSEMPGWALFRTEPMTHQTFTADDFESDSSSTVSSAGSTGSCHGQQPLRSRITRGSRVHHIPILVEAGGDDTTSGNSSDARSEENNQTMTNHSRESSSAKPQITHHKVNQPKPQGYQPKPQGYQPKPEVPHSGTPAQRSMSNQEVTSRPPAPHPKKSASQPPSSPPPQQQTAENVQPGPFVTQVRVNMPVTVESKQAQQSQDKKPDKPKPDPRKQIDTILCDMETLKEEVEKFTGTTKDKQYRYLDEMLTRLMLRLDDVNTEGQDGIRQERKNAVKKIQSCISRLEQKICENEPYTTLKRESSVPPTIDEDGKGPTNGENCERTDF